MSDLVKQGGEELTPKKMADLMANPILAAPEELRPAIWRIWSTHQHLFPTCLPIAASFGMWVREKGLPVEEAETILRRALSPARMAEFKFASDLLTYLAASVNDVLDKRRNQKELRAYR